jgi:chromosome segregation ATPase
MAKLLRKALGLFVEIDDSADTPGNTSQQNVITNPVISAPVSNFKFKNEDLEKFESHFDQLMTKANLPGPDYFEFCKMMEALESHVPDERARISAVFASLSVQGLTKDKLISTAKQYKDVFAADHDNFNNALNQKSTADIDEKKASCDALEKRMASDSEMIQKLTQEITDAQAQISKMKQEIADSEGKLENNKKGYEMAYNAMVQKINSDITDIQNTL